MKNANLYVRYVLLCRKCSDEVFIIGVFLYVLRYEEKITEISYTLFLTKGKETILWQKL